MGHPTVCDVITYNKPKDAKMQSLLREFLLLVCLFNFSPVVSKIGTKENNVADFFSRNFSEDDAKGFLDKNGISSMQKIPLTDSMFDLAADW